MRRLRRPRNGERGAELVELTLVLPLLILLGMGMLDAGMAWKSKVEVVHATRQGARVGSAFKDDPRSDQEALLAITAVIPEYLNLDPGDTISARLDYIVIYKADAADGQVPAACKNPGTYADCTHLTRTDVETFLTEYAGDPSALHLTRSWTNRPLEPANLDSLGVFIQATQPSFTGVFESLTTWTVTGSTVMRTEPEIS
jgi:Flp pilus assembly protein TadG